MFIRYLFILSILLISCENNSKSGLEAEIDALNSIEKQAEFLIKIQSLDQEIRNELNENEVKFGAQSQQAKESLKKMSILDEENLEKIECYIKTYGHPSIKLHGREAVFAPYLVYHHHSSLEIRETGFKHLYKAQKKGDLNADNLAFYLNRTYYIVYNGKRINWEGPYTVEEELDTLYKSLNLMPIIEEINESMNEGNKMNSLGLLGGTSWHSTIDYYKAINQQVNDFHGDNTNSPLLIYTLNQSKIHKHQVDNEWDKIAEMFIEGAGKLEAAGAEKLMFCANTPHKIFNKVQEKIKTPIIHIADATANEIKKKGINKVLFLGTKYTMTEPFVMERIAANNIEVLAPEKLEVVEELHRIIIEELTYSNILDESKAYVLEVIEAYRKKGVEGVILGCTEFPLMIFPEDLEIPIFNTTEIHANAGVEFILENIRNHE